MSFAPEPETRVLGVGMLPTDAHVAIEGLGDLSTKRDCARSAALAGDDRDLDIPIDVLDAQPCDLSQPDPRVDEEEHDRPVPPLIEALSGAGVR
jgi:hypothetical protein